ncbi:hypothetical protein [Sodalis glossinidius]|uniref:hypothetical protein n=1 Tax=Sodalis glossinidius TaxID=63612 RepID=UPI0005A4600E|nr:hypothetical protein [Sodalis glossinidius]
MLRISGRLSEDQWRYPHGHYRNSAWYFVGEHQGVFSDPKPWHEYGLEGSIYFQAGKGYFSLKKDGQPDLNNWDFPPFGESNGFWEYRGMHSDYVSAKQWENED